ncbi:MAG: GPR endopeptidase [Alicyclobacillus sp.]|nr:GPR endopeptidase [Alicyclobacillus sp.]
MATSADHGHEQSLHGPRTDLAVEAHEIAQKQATTIQGVDSSIEDVSEGIRVTRMHVRTLQGEKAVGKRKGHYVTIEAPGLRRRDPELQERVVAQFADEIERFLNNVPEDGNVLVVGLGNAHITPDSLGPLVADRMFVTRHLFRYMPEVLGDGFRTVAAVSPGVLGITGIETSEIVKGIVEHVQPDVVIAIDALAARSLDRVNSTIQISDAGIQPGSGVGNKRMALDKATLGVPCIAIGVPTVVEAATIANDAIDLVLEQLRSHAPGNGATEIFDQFSANEKWQMIRELLEPVGNNLMVTPKEIDEFVDDVAQVLAKGLNYALHPNMTMEEARVLTH